MKIIISESQHRRLFEEEQKVLHIPDFKIFGNDWDVLQRFFESKFCIKNEAYLHG